MKSVINVISGFLIGILLTIIVGWNALPSMMIHENVSPYSTEETVNKIKENAISSGWVVSGVKTLHKSVLKHGAGEILPVMLVELCQPNHAFNMLTEDENKSISVFMPCTVSVYEKSDGKTYISTMNAGLLGKMFGGTIADIMTTVALDQQGFIEFIK